jgi:type II secretory pathway pseudopilin PulG
MIELLAMIVLPLLLLAAIAWVMTREDAKLRRRARRYRELELEGIEELRRDDDPFPEQGRVEGAFLREPNGRAADTARVMHEELERVREHTRRAKRRRSRGRSLRRGRGSECLL